MQDESERIVSRLGVADMFECSPASVDRYEHDGIIPPRRRLSRGKVGWLYSELVAKMRALPVGRLTDRTSAARAAKKQKAEAA